MPSSEAGYFTVPLPSSPAGKCLNSDVEQFEGNLQLANETSLGFRPKSKQHVSVGINLSLPKLLDPD